MELNRGGQSAKGSAKELTSSQLKTCCSTVDSHHVLKCSVGRGRELKLTHHLRALTRRPPRGERLRGQSGRALRHFCPLARWHGNDRRAGDRNESRRSCVGKLRRVHVRLKTLRCRVGSRAHGIEVERVRNRARGLDSLESFSHGSLPSYPRRSPQPRLHSRFLERRQVGLAPLAWEWRRSHPGEMPRGS
jgi:hypothetical protein